MEGLWYMWQLQHRSLCQVEIDVEDEVKHVSTYSRQWEVGFLKEDGKTKCEFIQTVVSVDVFI